MLMKYDIVLRLYVNKGYVRKSKLRFVVLCIIIELFEDIVAKKNALLYMLITGN